MRKKPIKVPSIEVKFKNDTEHAFAEQIVKTGSYVNFFVFVIKKIVSNPSLFSSKGTQKEQVQKTFSNKEELTVIARLLESMNNSQSNIMEQINKSNESLSKMAEEIKTLHEIINIQQNSLTETVNLLSSTQEGLELLNKLNEESKIDLVKVVAETEKITEETKSNSAINESTYANLPPLISSDPTVGDSDEDDEWDLFGESEFSQEELEEMANRFKQG